jgi:L-ascorbate metabolism protein UlaG (beta-lactamase superfamily)
VVDLKEKKIIICSCSRNNSSSTISKKVGKNEFQIQYLGHSAFVLTDESDKSVGIDFYKKGAFPYSEDVPKTIGGFERSDLSKLLISHNHADHNFVPDGVEAIKGYDDKTYKVNEEPKLITIGKFDIGKYKTLHFSDNSMDNAVFVFNVDGVKVVDLGDSFGTMGDQKQLKELKDKLGKIDILMIPIGDPQCNKVDFNTLKNTMDLLDPKVVIPIHYWHVADKKEFSDNSSKLGYSTEDIKENHIAVSSEKLSSLKGKTIWNITPDKFSK